MIFGNAMFSYTVAELFAHEAGVLAVASNSRLRYPAPLATLI